MKVVKTLLVVGALLLGSAQIASAHGGPKWETPLIHGYGAIKDFKNAAIMPDKHMDYKVIFKITSAKSKDGINTVLFHMARMMNLLYAGGVKPSHIHMVGIIAGPATPIILNNDAYKKRMHKFNPNLNVLRQLTEHGAKIYVCDQAAAEHGINPNTEVNKYIIPSFSALITLPTFELKGYAFMP